MDETRAREIYIAELEKGEPCTDWLAFLLGGAEDRDLAALAAIQSAASMERGAAREAIIAALDRRIRGDGSTYNEGFDNAMRAAIEIVRHHLPPEQVNG